MFSTEADMRDERDFSRSVNHKPKIERSEAQIVGLKDRHCWYCNGAFTMERPHVPRHALHVGCVDAAEYHLRKLDEDHEDAWGDLDQDSNPPRF
ncbi:MAG: hypothetical protein WAM96_07670 [Candidatus Acidiferrales bacterium]